MHAFEIEYSIFGGFVILSGLVMVVIYSLTNPWWRTHVGRMMITYALAEVAMSSLLMFTVVFHWAPHWFRAIWFGLQTVVGCTFWFQTLVIIKLHLEQAQLKRTRQ